MVYQLLVSVQSYRGPILRIDGKRTNMARHGGIVTIPLSIAVEPKVLLSYMARLQRTMMSILGR